MSDNNSTSNSLVADGVAFTLAGVSTIACIISLGILLYYKMWQRFIYRLVLYITLSLLVLSLSDIFLYSIYITKVKAANLSINFSILTNSSATVTNGGLAIAAMHTACIAFCLYLMAFHNCQFTYKYDLFLIVPTVLYSVIVMILTTFWNLHIPHFKVAVYVVFCLPINYLQMLYSQYWHWCHCVVEPVDITCV